MANYLLLHFETDDSFFIADCNLIEEWGDVEKWGENEWVVDHEARQVKFECDKWMGRGTVMQVAEQKEDLIASMTKMREMRYTKTCVSAI